MSAIISATGNVGRCETRAMPNGDKVTNFSIASNKKIKGVETTTWINCVAFGKLAEMLEQHLARGSKVGVWGDMDNRSWEKDGVTQYRTECRVFRFEFLGGEKATERPAQQNPAPQVEDFNDDMPF